MSQASTVTIPNTFVADTPAVAAQVNANFSNVKTAVDDSNINSNDTDIASLLAAVTQLQTDLATANSKIAALEANSVLELDGYLQLSTINTLATAEFTNINVQINDGSNDTEGVVNGLGNLTIGYNEFSVNALKFCLDPIYLDSASCTGGGSFWGSNGRGGSHNLILGKGNSYASYAGLISTQSMSADLIFKQGFENTALVGGVVTGLTSTGLVLHLSSGANNENLPMVHLYSTKM